MSKRWAGGSKRARSSMPFVSRSATCLDFRRSSSTNGVRCSGSTSIPGAAFEAGAVPATGQRPCCLACPGSGRWPQLHLRPRSVRGRLVGLSPALVRPAEWRDRGQRTDRFRQRHRSLVQPRCRHRAWQVLGDDTGSSHRGRAHDTPSEPTEWSSEAGNIGLKRGDWVSVTPDDYGNPVYGSILAWTADEIVLRHEDPSVGKVNLRFPRVGFDTVPAEKQAA